MTWLKRFSWLFTALIAMYGVARWFEYQRQLHGALDDDVIESTVTFWSYGDEWDGEDEAEEDEWGEDDDEYGYED